MCVRNVINSLNNTHKNTVCRKFGSGIDHYSIVCIIRFTTQSYRTNQMKLFTDILFFGVSYGGIALTIYLIIGL